MGRGEPRRGSRSQGRAASRPRAAGSRPAAREGDRVGRGWSEEDAGAAASAAVPGQGNARSRARESEGGGGGRQVGGFSQRPRPPVSKKFAQLGMAVTSGFARISFRKVIAG